MLSGDCSAPGDVPEARARLPDAQVGVNAHLMNDERTGMNGFVAWEDRAHAELYGVVRDVSDLLGLCWCVVHREDFPRWPLSRP